MAYPEDRPHFYPYTFQVAGSKDAVEKFDLLLKTKPEAKAITGVIEDLKFPTSISICSSSSDNELTIHFETTPPLAEDSFQVNTYLLTEYRIGPNGTEPNLDKRADKVVEALRELFDPTSGHSNIDPIYAAINLSLDPLMLANQQRTGDGPTLREGPWVGKDDEWGEPANPDENHLHRINFNKFAEKFGNIKGEGVTVVILDTSPDIQIVRESHLVDFWADLKPPLNFLGPLLKEKDPELLNPPTLKTLPEESPKAHNKGSKTEPSLLGGTQLDHDYMQPYHGLMVASLVRQIAPAAKIFLFRVLNEWGEAPNSVVTLGLDIVYLLQKFKVKIAGNRVVKDTLVVNLSLGAYESMHEAVDYENYLVSTQRLCKNGAIITAASGNFSFENHPFNPLEPSAFGYFRDTEALNTRLITVAATGAEPTKYAWFSNQSYLAAPGLDILMDLNKKITALQKEEDEKTNGNYVLPQKEEDKKTNGNYVLRQRFKWSGTSFATPMVAGAATLLLGSGVNNSDVKRILWDTATLPTDWNGIRELNLFEAFNHSITQKVIANTKPMTATQVEPVSEQ